MLDHENKYLSAKIGSGDVAVYQGGTLPSEETIMCMLLTFMLGIQQCVGGQVVDGRNNYMHTLFMCTYVDVLMVLMHHLCINDASLSIPLLVDLASQVPYT